MLVQSKLMTREKYSVLKEDSLPEECFICLDPVHSKDLAGVNCAHVFHEKCLQEWICSEHNQVGRVCPVCSRPLSCKRSMSRSCGPCSALNERRSSGCVIV